MCIHVGVFRSEVNLEYCSSGTIPFVFSLSVTEKAQLVGLVTKNSSILQTLSHAEVTDVHYHDWLLNECWGLNSGHYACTAITLLPLAISLILIVTF